MLQLCAPGPWRQGTPLDLESNLRPFLNSDHHEDNVKSVPNALLGVLFESYVSLYLLPPEVLGHLVDQVAPPRKKHARATSRAGKAIERTYRFPDFKAAMVFINWVAALALAGDAASTRDFVLDFERSGVLKDLLGKTLAVARSFLFLSTFLAYFLEAFGKSPLAGRDYAAVTWRVLVVLLLLWNYQAVFGGVIGLLDISKPRGNVLLDELERLLAARFPEAEIKRYAKPTFANTIEALDRTGELLEKVQGVFMNLTGAETNDELQAVARQVACF